MEFNITTMHSTKPDTPSSVSVRQDFIYSICGVQDPFKFIEYSNLRQNLLLSSLVQRQISRKNNVKELNRYASSLAYRLLRK
jgi:hypothetical protein